MSVRKQILILLACSLLAGKYGIEWSDAANQAAASARAATTKADQAERLLKSVQERLDPDLTVGDASPLLETRLADTVAKLHRQAKNCLMDLNQVVPEGVATGSSMRPVSDLVQTNGAGIPFVRLQIKGQYKSLAGLERFTQAVGQGFVGISKLKVDRDAFEMDIEIYGDA